MSLTSTIAHAVLFTVFVWWFTTGAILYLDGLPRRTFKLSMAAATVLLAAALHGLWVTQHDQSVTGAYLAFSCALIAWGWNEMAFLMGYITGPRREPCPAGAEGLIRFKLAAETVIWHELAIALTALAIFVLTADATNRTGFQTFAILWVLRLSAKANVFLGVRNLSEEFLPAHLRYLESYFRRRSMNPVFPISVTATAILIGYLWGDIVAPGASPFEVTAAALLATLAALALLEHWMMVLPIPANLLWQWGLASREPAAELAPPSEAVAASAVPTIVPFPPITKNTVPRRRP